MPKNIAEKIKQNSQINDLKFEIFLNSQYLTHFFDDYIVYEITKEKQPEIKRKTKKVIIGSIITAIIFLTLFFVLRGQNYSEFTKYTIPEVGYISIPNNMEIQSGDFKIGANEYYDDIEPSATRIIFQPKGVNNYKESALANYARVTVKTYIENYGNYENLTTSITATRAELSEIDSEFKAQSEEGAKLIKCKIVKWNKVELIKINNATAIKISYIRTAVPSKENNSPVVVEMYYFQNNDRMHVLTLSYRQSNEGEWKPLFEKVANSFKITNVR